MKIVLNEKELLERRRVRDGLEPLRSDCSIEYTEGVDIDRQLLQDLRSRYLAMLDRAAPRYLAIESVEPVKVTEACGDGVGVELPADCRRVLDITLDSWARPAMIQPPAMYGAIVSWQYNEYRAATPLNPVAVIGPDRVLYAWPGGAVERVSGVIDPGEGAYVLDDSGLDELLNHSKDKLWQ